MCCCGSHEAAPPRHLRRVFALAERLRPWSMIEVFVFGVFVAYVKLGDLVHITLDTGVYALFALTFVMIWADSALDREAVWERLDRAESGRCVAPQPVAAACPMRSVARSAVWSALRGRTTRGCPRCALALHARKPDSMRAPGRW